MANKMPRAKTKNKRNESKTEPYHDFMIAPRPIRHLCPFAFLGRQQTFCHFNSKELPSAWQPVSYDHDFLVYVQLEVHSVSTEAAQYQ